MSIAISDKGSCTVIAAYKHYHAHKGDKQLVNGLVVKPGADFTPNDTAAYAAPDHQAQRKHAEIRCAAAKHREQQICSLTEKNDVQGVCRRLLAFHAEEIVQYHQIEGASANAEKAGEAAQQQADNQAGRLAFCGAGLNAAFV